MNISSLSSDTYNKIISELIVGDREQYSLGECKRRMNAHDFSTKVLESMRDSQRTFPFYQSCITHPSRNKGSAVLVPAQRNDEIKSHH